MTVEDTVVAECSSPGGACAGQEFGTGIVIAEGAVSDMSQVLVSGSAFAGLQVVRGGDVFAQGLALVNNVVGLNIDGDSVTMGEQIVDEQFRGNEQDIVTSQLPVPAAADLLDELNDMARE